MPPLNKYSGKLKVFTSAASATPSDSPTTRQMVRAFSRFLAGALRDFVDVLRRQFFAELQQARPSR
jgi:hypothetical protein